VVEIADEVVGGSESLSLVCDHLGLVIEPFDRAVIDGHVKQRQGEIRSNREESNKKSIELAWVI
jgi:hypothetical protein